MIGVLRHVTKTSHALTRSLRVSGMSKNVNFERRAFSLIVDSSSSSKEFESHGRSLSFISKAKAMGANALLGAFITNSGRFDESLKGLNVERMEKGEVECTLKVEKALENAYAVDFNHATHFNTHFVVKST